MPAGLHTLIALGIILQMLCKRNREDSLPKKEDNKHITQITQRYSMKKTFSGNF